jgi:hypothetical protein
VAPHEEFALQRISCLTIDGEQRICLVWTIWTSAIRELLMHKRIIKSQNGSLTLSQCAGPSPTRSLTSTCTGCTQGQHARHPMALQSRIVGYPRNPLDHFFPLRSCIILRLRFAGLLTLVCNKMNLSVSPSPAWAPCRN